MDQIKYYPEPLIEDLQDDQDMALDDLLNHIGRNPEEIANYLLTAGIKGIRSKPCDCPIATLIRRYAVIAEPFEVTEIQIRFVERDGGPDYTFPQPVQEFIKRFDEGEWPELELSY